MSCLKLSFTFPSPGAAGPPAILTEHIARSPLWRGLVWGMVLIASVCCCFKLDSKETEEEGRRKPAADSIAIPTSNQRMADNILLQVTGLRLASAV